MFNKPNSVINKQWGMSSGVKKFQHRRMHTETEEGGVKYYPQYQYSKAFTKQYSRPKFLENKHIRVGNVQAQKDNPSKILKFNKQAMLFSRNLKTEANEEPSETNRTTRPKGNKYEIQGIAGKGTFGVVYHGKVRLTGEKIAIKKVLQDRKYKNRELQILKQVKHCNILQMKDYYLSYEKEEEYLNVVMEYYQENLYQTIKKKQLTPLLLKLYTYQILRGLNYLTILSISHRDIKPQNILVDRNRHSIVICDFGSAKKLVRGEPNIAYICSRCYRAPQLIFGAGEYTTQIDMWSTGCVLVQMINGEAPFLGDSQIDQLLEIIKVLGTPSRKQIQQMNPNYDLREYKKFPNIKTVPWSKVLKTQDPLLADLVSKIMQYSPIKRLSPSEAMNHPYFDELKDANNFKMLKHYPNLFNYSQEQRMCLMMDKKSEISTTQGTNIEGRRISHTRRRSELR